MKRLTIIFILFASIINPVLAVPELHISFCDKNLKQERAVKQLLMSQVKYANHNNFDKFINTFDKSYKNSDGFDYEIYKKMVKEIWDSYDNIRYGMSIKDIKIDNNDATVIVDETSKANLTVTKKYSGKLKSNSNSVYYLKKIDDKWKVVSDEVLDETTYMLYGEANDLDINLTVPTKITANTDYTATLNFVPNKDVIAIASITADKVEYPQKTAKEVFRTLPEDYILERIFTANSDNANEYVVASIGLTRTDLSDLSIKVSLSGFGYIIRRVNVVPVSIEEKTNEQN